MNVSETSLLLVGRNVRNKISPVWLVFTMQEAGFNLLFVASLDEYTRLLLPSNSWLAITRTIHGHVFIYNVSNAAQISRFLFLFIWWIKKVLYFYEDKRRMGIRMTLNTDERNEWTVVFFCLANNYKRTNTCIKMLFINIKSETYSNLCQHYSYTFKNDQWVTICTKERNSFRSTIVKILSCSKPQAKYRRP